VCAGTAAPHGDDHLHEVRGDRRVLQPARPRENGLVSPVPTALRSDGRPRRSDPRRSRDPADRSCRMG
jgi:hypothetical protein